MCRSFFSSFFFFFLSVFYSVFCSSCSCFCFTLFAVLLLTVLLFYLTCYSLSCYSLSCYPLFTHYIYTNHVSGDGDGDIDVGGEPVENGINGADDHSPQNGVEASPAALEPHKPSKVVKKIRVTYEEYRTIANLLILHLRHIEETAESGGSCDRIASHVTM